MSVKRHRKPQPPHWYKLYIGECPCCGRDKSYRERVYGEKPKQDELARRYLPDTTTYDGCVG